MTVEQGAWLLGGGEVALALLIVLCVWYLSLRIEAQHERTRMEAQAIQRDFLRAEYDRLAAESGVYHAQLHSLIVEVQTMARAFRDAMSKEDWDPEQHIAILERLDGELGRMVKDAPHI